MTVLMKATLLCYHGRETTTESDCRYSRLWIYRKWYTVHDKIHEK